jgi:phage anti-repressor protein
LNIAYFSLIGFLLGSRSQPSFGTAIAYIPCLKARGFTLGIVRTNEQGLKVVSARELFEFLEVKERFSRFMERNLEYGFQENVDYTLYQMVHPSNLQEVNDYALTLDCAKEISMIQRSEKGRQARQYFIECEKQLPMARLKNNVTQIHHINVEMEQNKTQIEALKQRNKDLANRKARIEFDNSNQIEFIQFCGFRCQVNNENDV